MADRLLDLGQGLAIYRFGLDELREQDVNARHMTESMFGRLTSTIGRDKRLESLPLIARVALPEGKERFEVVSGHHRTRAARSAGMTEVFGIVDETGLSRAQIRAKQLAHNSIQGEDDPDLVKRIFAGIDDVDAQLEAFIDPTAIDALIARAKTTDLDVGLTYRTALLVFVPYEQACFEAALSAVEASIDGDLARVYMAELALLPTFQHVLRRAGKAYDVRAIGTTLAKMAQIVEAHLGTDPPGTDPVAIRDVFGATFIPADLAARLAAAIETQTTAKTLPKGQAWRLLERLVAE